MSDHGFSAFLAVNGCIFDGMPLADVARLAYEAGVQSRPRRGAKFEGGPCAKCGGTVRYVSNRACVSCHCERQNP